MASKDGADAGHRIQDIKWPRVYCSCGWSTFLHKSETWGKWRGYDWLLDAHSDHVRRKGKKTDAS